MKKHLGIGLALLALAVLILAAAYFLTRATLRHPAGFSIQYPRFWKVVYQDDVRVNIAAPKGLEMGPRDGIKVKVFPNPQGSKPDIWYEKDAEKIPECDLFVPLDPLIVASKRMDTLNGQPCLVVVTTSNDLFQYVAGGRQMFEISTELHGTRPRQEALATVASFRLR